MGFVEAVKSVLGNYANFSGRARRSEYWFWYLAVTLYYTVALIALFAVKFLGVLLLIGILGIIIPTLAVNVRRLHDSGKSGWLLLIAIIPFGGLVLFVFTLLDSNAGPNQYGPNPKGLGGYPPAGEYGTPPPGYGPAS